MRLKPRSLKSLFGIAAALFCLALVSSAYSADSVILLLRNGDRITGTIASQDTNRIVLTTPWIKELVVPLSQISKREPVPPAQKPPSPAVGAGATAGPASPPLASKPPTLITGELTLGTDLGFSEKNRQLYTGRAKLILGYRQFKNTFDYDFSYGENAGVLAANRMDGFAKTDVDLNRRVYVYSLAGAGYDEIRKIKLRYEFGPGVGYHVVKITNFVFNTESGVAYQAQRLTDDTFNDSIFLRLAENLNWQFNARLSWDEKFEFFPEVEDFDVFRFRFETNLRYQLFSKLSWNLTVIDQYDTRPAQTVTRNDLQVRSSVGVKF